MASELADERSDAEDEGDEVICETQGKMETEETLKVDGNGQIKGPQVLLNGAPVEEETLILGQKDKGKEKVRRRK